MLQGSPQKKPGAKQKALELKQSEYGDGINPSNYKFVKDTLQSSINFNWTKKKTVEELRKYAGVTVRQAREIIKNELSETRRWEDGIQEEEKDD